MIQAQLSRDSCGTRNGRGVSNGPKRNNIQCTKILNIADEINTYVSGPAVVNVLRSSSSYFKLILSTEALYIFENLREKFLKGADYLQN